MSNMEGSTIDVAGCGNRLPPGMTATIPCTGRMPPVALQATADAPSIERWTYSMAGDRCA